MRTARRTAWSLLALICTVTLLVVVPRVVGTTWSAVGRLIVSVSPAALAGLAGIWIAGLWAHSWVLAASLPGLTKRQALRLSLAGSAVSNVLPLGGAAGTGLNLAMVRSWGFSTGRFTRFLAVTQLLNVLSKLAVVALAAVVVHNSVPLPRQGTTLLAVPAIVAIAASLVVLLIPQAAAWCGRTVSRVSRREAAGAALARVCADIRGSLTSAWRVMSGGMLAYLLLQAILLWLCFAALGSPLAPVALLAAFAAERLLTLVVITPGGAGVVEAGMVAALVATGTDPAVATAGLVLFRGFTFLLEIPVGGVVLAGWLAGRSRRPQLAGGHR